MARSSVVSRSESCTRRVDNGGIDLPKARSIEAEDDRFRRTKRFHKDICRTKKRVENFASGKTVDVQENAALIGVVMPPIDAVISVRFAAIERPRVAVPGSVRRINPNDIGPHISHELSAVETRRPRDVEHSDAFQGLRIFDIGQIIDSTPIFVPEYRRFPSIPEVNRTDYTTTSRCCQSQHMSLGSSRCPNEYGRSRQRLMAIASAFESGKSVEIKVDQAAPQAIPRADEYQQQHTI